MSKTWHTERKDWTQELQPWPEGIKFGKLALPEYTRRLTVTRPETHRPYGTSAAWAVGGGSDA